MASGLATQMDYEELVTQVAYAAQRTATSTAGRRAGRRCAADRRVPHRRGWRPASGGVSALAVAVAGLALFGAAAGAALAIRNRRASG